SELGAVVTLVSIGTSQEGFDGEWRMADIFTIKGNLINRLEIFDEADLNTALARFDELHPQAPRLENVASQVAERFRAFFAARDWDALAELLADDYSHDDRRRVVGAGVRDGRDAQIADLRAIADLWITNVKMTVIATRGERLVLRSLSFSNRDQGSEAFLSDVLSVAEINADGRYLANVTFELDDLDAAFEELDARYIAGEAATCARTWSVTARTCAVFNQGKLPATTPDSVFVDHRPVLTVDAVDLPAYLRVMWDLTPDIRVDIEAVHRLSELGAVVTHAVNETSPEGFNAEWRGILIYTLEADMVKRCEVFDESDLDAALARFDELEEQAAN
ncbi:MAG TPA: hypothetical protein VE908_20075, partial [Mycobacterium sp.]|nr:hypothetical protein [Mycobacterium sp.]